MYKSLNEWLSIWKELSNEELDKVALLRVIECTNGVIQHLYREDSPKKLSIEQTRAAMNFSMKAMKTMEIPLKSGLITFTKETELRLREARDLYIRAFKQNEDEAYSAFFNCSEASVRVVGETRLYEASYKIDQELYDVFPVGTSEWGLQYLRRFLA